MEKLTRIKEKLINTAKNKNRGMAFVTAGGGVGLYQLFTVPGCGKVMAEARMLYNAQSFSNFFGYNITEKFVSQDMADKMAEKLAELTATDVAFALTCAFQTDRVRRGSDHGFIAICYQGKIALKQEIKAEGNSRDEQDYNMSKRVLEIVVDFLQSL